MPVTYSIPAINSRLLALANVIDQAGNGFLILRAGAANVCSIQLANPCAAVDGGVLTFDAPLQETADASGVVTEAIMTDAAGVIMIEHLTVGVPPTAGYDIYISNSKNTTEVVAGNVVTVLSAQIQGE